MKLKKANCETCINENCLIKKNLDAVRSQGYLEAKRTIMCGKAQSFILEGSPVHGLFFIFDGKAKVYSRGLEGRDQIIRFAGNGDIVGHRGLLTFESYKISATAVDDSVLCHFSSEVLIEMLHSIAGLS